jgi:hypothetical protein
VRRTPRRYQYSERELFEAYAADLIADIRCCIRYDETPEYAQFCRRELRAIWQTRPSVSNPSPVPVSVSEENK